MPHCVFLPYPHHAVLIMREKYSSAGVDSGDPGQLHQCPVVEDSVVHLAPQSLSKRQVRHHRVHHLTPEWQFGDVPASHVRHHGFALVYYQMVDVVSTSLHRLGNVVSSKVQNTSMGQRTLRGKYANTKTLSNININ